MAKSFNFGRFVSEAMKDGIFTGDRESLIRLLVDCEGVVKVRTVEEWKGDKWVEVLKDLPWTMLSSFEQQIGGVQVVERWVEMEGGGFVRELIKPQTFIYD